MKLRKLTVLSFLFMSIFQSACASERIFDIRENRFISRETMLDQIAQSDDLVVGEKHDTKSIQNSEALLFADFAKGRHSRVTFAWEFWSWSGREKLEMNFLKFRSGEISGKAFLRTVFGEKNPEMTYLPLMEAVKAASAEVLATNLTRAEKAPVVQRGLDALDPKLLPPDFEPGGTEYFERFALSMEGHGNPSEIRNYFAAQSLVDDVAAFHFTQDRKTPSAFLLIGNFHTRYFDGVWKRLEKRASDRRRILVEIADSDDEKDWDAVLNHTKYGTLADFIIFTK